LIEPAWYLRAVFSFLVQKNWISFVVHLILPGKNLFVFVLVHSRNQPQRTGYYLALAQQHSFVFFLLSPDCIFMLCYFIFVFLFQQKMGASERAVPQDEKASFGPHKATSTRHFVLGAHELMDIYGILSLVCI